MYSNLTLYLSMLYMISTHIQTQSPLFSVSRFFLSPFVSMRLSLCIIQSSCVQPLFHSISLSPPLLLLSLSIYYTYVYIYIYTYIYIPLSLSIYLRRVQFFHQEKVRQCWQGGFGPVHNHMYIYMGNYIRMLYIYIYIIIHYIIILYMYIYM